MNSERPPVRRPACGLQAAVRDAWRVETLEPRLLLSADPLVAGLMALAPGEGVEAPVQGAYSAAAAVLPGAGAITPLSDPPIVRSTDLVAPTGNIELVDSLRIDGNVRIEATQGSVRLGNENTDYVGGHTAGTADTLTVVAGEDVRFFGAVGDGTAASDALHGLTIQAGDDVSFDREVIVNGDLVIDAGGVVTFNDGLTLRNGGSLIVQGATQIVFFGAVTLQLGLAPAPGDVLLEADEIDLAIGSEQFSGGGEVTLRPATLGLPIALLSPAGALTAGVLNLETAELRAFADGFAGFVIGHQGVDGRAAAGTGAVSIGASTVLDSLSLFDPLAVYGGSITVVDFSNPAAMLRLGEGDALTLEAVGDVTIGNEVEADALNLVSAAGRIVQTDATADNLAGEALRTLALTASAATGITLPSVEAATVQASNSGSGDVAIGLNPARITTRFDDAAIDGSVEVLGLAQTDAGSDGSISLVTADGSIVLAGSGVAIAGGGGLTLTAQGDGSDLTLTAPVALVDGPASLTAADALTSTAAGSITASGAAAITLGAGGALQLGAGVQTVGGSVAFEAGGSLDFSGVTLSAGPGGSLSLQAEGDLTVGIVEAEQAITLRSLGGAIRDGLAGDDANLRGEAALATLQAATGIGSAGAALRTAVGALQAQTDAGGGIFVRDESALSVEGLATAGAGDGVIAVQAATGTLTVAGAVAAQADGTGHVLLQALDGNLDVQAEVLALGGSISLVASQALALQGAMALDVRTATAGQTLDLRAGGAVTMGGDARLLSQGAQRVAAGAGLTLGQVDAGGADVALSAGGRVVLAADGSSPDVTAASLRLQAGGDVADASRALRTTAGALAVSAGGGAWVAADGNVSVDALEGVIVREVQADGTAPDAAAALALAGWTAGGVGVLDAGAALQVDAAVQTGSHLRLAAAGDLTLAAAIDSQGGHVTLLAGGDVRAGDAADIDTGGGGFDLEAGAALAFAAGHRVDSAGGDQRLVAAGAASIGVLDAGIGNVTLAAASITALSEAGGADVIGDRLRLTTTDADAGSGSRALALQVQALAAQTAGGWFAQDDGNLAVTTLAAADAVRVGSDGTLQTLTGADAAVSGLSAGAALALQVGGALTVDAGVQAGTALYLAADAALALAADSSAGGAASLHAGAAMTVDGALTAASLDVQAGATLTMADASVATAGSQRWQAAGDLLLGRLLAADGDVALIAGGDLRGISSSGEADVVSSRLWIDVAGTVGAGSDALAVAGGRLAVQAGGDVFMASAAALRVDAVQVAVDRVAADVQVQAGASEGGAGVTAAALALDGAASLNLDAAVAAQGPVRLAAGDAVAVDAVVDSGGGALTLLAGGDIGIAADLSSGGGVVDVGATGAVSMAAGTRLHSADADLRLAAGQAIQLASVDAGTGFASVVGASVNGQSLDAGDAHIAAAVLRLQATGGGLGAANAALVLAVDRLAAAAAGDTLVLDATRTLVVDALTAVQRQQVATDGSVQTLAGDDALAGLTGAGFVRLDAQGTVSVQAAVQAGGALRLAAWGDAADIAATAALQSGGAASLLAGRDIDLAAAWQAGGTVSAEAGRDLRLAAPLTIADADAWLAAGGSATLGDVDLGTGRLALSAASLSATGLAQAAAAAIDVTGAVGSAAAPVELSVGALALRAGGDAFVHDAGALALVTVAPEVARVEADGGSTALAWTGPGGLQVGGVAVLIADGDLGLDVASAIGGGRLEAAAGSLALDAALASDRALSLLASADIALSAGIAATGDASVDLQAGGRLQMTDAAVVSAEQGGLRLAAVGTMTLGALATEGAVSLSARSIADAGTSDLDIRAQTLRVFTTGGGTTEGFGSGARPIQTQVDTLAADVAGTGAGGFFAIEADGLTVGSVGALQVSRIGTDGVASALNDAALSGLRSAGNVVLQAIDGDLRIAGADDDGVGLRAGGNLRLEALDGDLTTTAALRSGAGHATLLASGAVSLGADMVLERAGRTIDIDVGGDVTQAVGTRIATAGGDLRIAAGGNLALDFASAGSGRISLQVADVFDAGADDAVDLLAAGLRLVSADGIGREDQRLQTQASTVSARAAGGGIWLQEADAIRVGDVTATVQRVGLNGTVSALVDAVQSDLVTTAGNGSIALATRNGDIDLLDGTAPADGRSVVAHGSGRILLDVQGAGAVLDAAGNVLAQPGPVVLDSGLRIQGVLDWTAGVGGVAGDGAITIAGAVDGNPGNPADSLVLRADGAVNIGGPIGATAALEDLRIEGATDVTLGSTVTLTGDLYIAASGVVRIDGDVLLSGGSLEIVGASEVVLAGVSLGSGDVRIAADRLTVAGRLAGSAHALLWLTAADGGAIGYGSDDGALRVDAALLSQVDGFGRLQIGDADTAFVRMAAGSTLDTGGRQLMLQAAGDIGVSSIVAGSAGVVLASTAGTIGEVGNDAAADVQAAWLSMRGRGPELPAGASTVAAALEVASTRVDIDGGGVVLRDSAPDGSVRYNLLADGRLFQQLVAGADVQREASGPAPMDPAEVAARLQALRAGDADSDTARDVAGLDWLRRPLALDPREAPALPAMTAAPLHDGGWLAQRLLAAPWADAEVPQGVADAGNAPARVELWIDPLEL